MKKSIILLLAVVCVTLACHTKKEVAKETPKPYVYEPTTAELTAGKTKFADLTKDNLIKGRYIYYGTCVRCHEPKNINEYGLDEFSGILDNMARKAKLTPDEKDAVLRYAVAVKLSGSK